MHPLPHAISKLFPALSAALLLLSPLAASAQDDAPAAAREPSRGERIARALEDKGCSTEVAIGAISLLPIVELRGAIPAGHLLLPRAPEEKRFGAADRKRSAKIFALAVVGNMLPIPFILLLLGPVSSLCMKVPLGKKFFDWLFARTRRKTAGLERYEFFALTVFVAIPLPVTGAWTGAVAGWLMGMRFWRALASIFLGVCGAGVIMTALSLLGWLGAGIALAVLLLLAVSALRGTGNKAAAA
ncbi:MAG: small multi-drug export protein [Kiritimatiellae bacterium]|nr:small multi-drug export protein [Kiritimatiellia bacterium]